MLKEAGSDECDEMMKNPVVDFEGSKSGGSVEPREEEGDLALAKVRC